MSWNWGRSSILSDWKERRTGRNQQDFRLVLPTKALNSCQYPDYKSHSQFPLRHGRILLQFRALVAHNLAHVSSSDEKRIYF